MDEHLAQGTHFEIRYWLMFENGHDSKVKFIEEITFQRDQRLMDDRGSHRNLTVEIDV